MNRSFFPENNLRYLILFFILGCQAIVPFYLSSQGLDRTNLLFKYLTLESGLPNNKVNAVTMDKYGFMWFGTNDGICRYDGFKIKNYPLDNFSGNLPRTSQISVIKNDSKGNLLIGSYSLFRFDFINDRMVRCDSSDQIDRTGRVYAIVEGNQNNVWIGSENGLFSYNTETDSLTAYPSGKDIEMMIISLLFDNEKLWIGTRNDGLFVFDIDKKSFSDIPHFGLSLEVKDQINCFYKDKKSVVWAGTQDNGIFKFNPADSSLQHILPDTTNKISYRIRKIINDRYGNIWVGSRLGIFLQEVGSDSLVLIKQVDPLPSKTRSNSIYDIFIDPNEIMWLGTFSFGVSYTDFRRKPFHLYNRTDDETLFNMRMVNCFTDCDNENIWIGTEENGLFCFNRNNSKYIQYKPEPLKKNSLNGVNVRALAKKSDGNLWIGYYSSGLDYLNLETGKITHFINEKNNAESLSSNTVRALLLDDKENLWIGTDRGVDLLKNGSKSFRHYLTNDVLQLYMDKKGQIWAGTSGNGIFRYNVESGDFEKVYSQYFSTTIKDILVDSRDNLWVGTNKGLFCIESLNDSLIFSGTEQGLPSNAILDLLEDGSNNIWVSTGAGLVKCEGAVSNPRSFIVKQFSNGEGLQGEYFRESASYKNKKGEFYFGGVEGFNIFSPDSIKSNPYPPKMAFTQLKLFNQNVEIGEIIKGKTVLEKAINETKLLTLSYKHNPVSIEFAALHFSNPDKNKYRYRLSPLEKEWNYSAGIRNFATYSNLKGGDYLFVLEAGNSDGVWNNLPLTLKIKVIPPFWKTGWFIALIILILSSTVFGYYLNRIYLLKRYSSELESKVEDRTRKLKESLNQVLEKQSFIEEQSKVLQQQKDQLQELNSTKDKFFSIISHDLRSPFQSLLGLSEMLISEIKESDKNDLKITAQAIYDSSNHIFTLVENLLTWARAQTKKITFEPVEIDLSKLIEDVILLMSQNLNKKNITVEKEFKSGKKAFGDINMVEMTLCNLLTNAIKFTPDNGKIKISITESSGNLQVKIQDTGIGISEEDQKKLFRIESNYSTKGTRGETGTGLGLILCKEFIEKNNGKIRVESKLGEGSSFFFTLPAGNI